LSDTVEHPETSFQSIVDALLAELVVSRVTLRLDTPGRNFPAVAEAVAQGVDPIIQDDSLDQRNAPTAQWIIIRKEILVQPNCETAEPRPPAALIEVYGVRAQMLAPVIGEGAVIGWVSVHETRGQRNWTAHEVDAIRKAALAAGALCASDVA
jgi:maleate isomerase